MLDDASSGVSKKHLDSAYQVSLAECNVIAESTNLNRFTLSASSHHRGWFDTTSNLPSPLPTKATRFYVVKIKNVPLFLVPARRDTRKAVRMPIYAPEPQLDIRHKSTVCPKGETVNKLFT